jgi:hypothetical protein
MIYWQQGPAAKRCLEHKAESPRFHIRGDGGERVNCYTVLLCDNVQKEESKGSHGIQSWDTNHPSGCSTITMPRDSDYSGLR